MDFPPVPLWLVKSPPCASQTEMPAGEGPTLGSSCSAAGAHLAHEAGDDAVEAAALVPEALLSGAKGAEVLGGLGHHVRSQLWE